MLLSSLQRNCISEISQPSKPTPPIWNCPLRLTPWDTLLCTRPSSDILVNMNLKGKKNACNVGCSRNHTFHKDIYTTLFLVPFVLKSKLLTDPALLKLFLQSLLYLRNSSHWWSPSRIFQLFLVVFDLKPWQHVPPSTLFLFYVPWAYDIYYIPGVAGAVSEMTNMQQNPILSISRIILINLDITTLKLPHRKIYWKPTNVII